jgi:hypothetical protein
VDLNQISEKEKYKLNESLVYCMISTMMALPDNRYELSAEPYIHWDRSYRLIPAPPLLLWE